MENRLKYNRNRLNDNDESFLLKEYLYNYEIKVTYSVIVPIYDQQNIIVKNLKSIINFTHGFFELILILDFCNDKTEKNIIKFFKNYENNNKKFYGVRIFKQPNSPIFEASCDNIGFVHSYGDYCLEIQADMEMIMPGYNLHISKPFSLLENVFAVSGRCAHNIFRDGGVGKLGRLLEKPIKDLHVNPNIFYVYETCNRGPLLFSKKKLQEINFLDEKNYHQDNSDHDAIIRAFLYKKYISGYVPIDFLSPLQDGTFRKKQKNTKYNDINNYYKILRQKQQNGIDKYKPTWKPRKPLEFNIENVEPIL